MTPLSSRTLAVLGATLVAVALGVVVLLLLALLSTPTMPAHPHAGDYVRVSNGVASWSDELHGWTFCPAGWTDLQCGS